MEQDVSLQSVAALAAQLNPIERLRLVERIAGELAASEVSNEPSKRRRWREIRGMAVHPMCGEDAQTWVSRTRQEADREAGHYGGPRT